MLRKHQEKVEADHAGEKWHEAAVATTGELLLQGRDDEHAGEQGVQQRQRRVANLR